MVSTPSVRRSGLIMNAKASEAPAAGSATSGKDEAKTKAADDGIAKKSDAADTDQTDTAARTTASTADADAAKRKAKANMATATNKKSEVMVGDARADTMVLAAEKVDAAAGGEAKRVTGPVDDAMAIVANSNGAILIAATEDAIPPDTAINDDARLIAEAKAEANVHAMAIVTNSNDARLIAAAEDVIPPDIEADDDARVLTAIDAAIPPDDNNNNNARLIATATAAIPPDGAFVIRTTVDANANAEH